MINFNCTWWLDCWVCAMCSKADFCLPYHLGNPSTKHQAFQGIQTNNSIAVWGSSVLPEHFSVDEIKETWASGGSEKHWPCAWQSLLHLHSFLEYWPCFSWRCIWGDVEGKRMGLSSFLEEVWVSCKPEVCAGLFPCSRLAWLTHTPPASSSMVCVSSVGHAHRLVMLLSAIGLPSWIGAATDCWGVARSSSLWWNSFVLLSPSSWQ